MWGKIVKELEFVKEFKIVKKTSVHPWLSLVHFSGFFTSFFCSFFAKNKVINWWDWRIIYLPIAVTTVVWYTQKKYQQNDGLYMRYINFGKLQDSKCVNQKIDWCLRAWQISQCVGGKMQSIQPSIYLQIIFWHAF